jgi:hypothetical protein
MNYSQPRQRKTDQRWDYTNRNDNMVYPIGYCHKFVDLSEDKFVGEYYRVNKGALEKLYASSGKYHTSGHSTYEEACGCYKEYLLDNSIHVGEDKDTMFRCDICSGWSNTWVTVGFGVGIHLNLCPEHTGRQFIEKLFKVGESIHS